jgi:hypothetical protein
MTAIANITPATVQRAALVTLERITYSDDFWFRSGGIDPSHKADLASTIRNTERALDPVILWHVEGQPEDGELLLLDGVHRIAAYQAVGWLGPIPAIIVTCNRRAALRAALSGNSRRSLQLTQAERMDAAWRLVRESFAPRYTVREIVAAADVSVRTVKYMRDRFRTMHEEGIEITGRWATDRAMPDMSDELAGMMNDTQRKAEIGKLAADVRDLLDRRKHPERAVLRDSQAVEEAILEALGDNRIKAMFEYFFGEAEDANEWLAFAQSANDIAGQDAGEDVGEDDEPESQF